MKLSLWYRTKTVACLLRIISILPNVEGIISSGLMLLAETNFKSNYEPTSALKGSSSNYYYSKPQQQQQQQEKQSEFNNYYSDSGELKLRIVNDTPLTREEQKGFVAGANGFVPTAIIAAGQQTINGYNSNNGNLQNMYGNSNYFNNNNHNNNQNSNQHEFNVDVENSFVGNLKKYMKIPNTINNRNYVPITSTGDFQYEQLYADGHYDEENQQNQQQQQPISYLHDYENMQQKEEEQKQYYNNDGDLDENIFSIQTTQLPKGIYNTQTTNFLQQQQQQLGILRQLQKLTLPTNNKKLESSNKRPKYYDQQQQQQQYQPLHSQWPTTGTRTIVHHNPQSEAALADIPLARHVEVTKQVPVVVEHQRIFQPYNQSVPVEVPQTVINTQSRPVPIQVPVAHTIAVPEIRDLHIPIEKLHPYPVERPIPYMVERHKPYSVERQVAIPYYYPYPIHVPIVKTVVHKSPAHKHAKSSASAHGGGWVIKRVQRQPASLFH